MKVFFDCIDIKNLTSDNIKLIRYVVPVIQTNCYLLIKNNKCILIDAGGDANTFIKYFEEYNIELFAIILTHGHYDHINAVNDLLDYYKNIKVYGMKYEKDVFENEVYNLTLVADNRPQTIKNIKYLEDDYILRFEDSIEIKTILTSGHTIGSCCYYLQKYKILFSGDTLFFNSYGRCDLFTGNIKNIENSINKKIMKLDDDVLVLPGHGKNTYIGYERIHNDICNSNYFKGLLDE